MVIEGGEQLEFDEVVICTGHKWPVKNEGVTAGYFDSPYPPSKLKLKMNHPVAIKGSSLTAIDAIRTLVRSNGTFDTGRNDKLTFTLAGLYLFFILLLFGNKHAGPGCAVLISNAEDTVKTMFAADPYAGYIFTDYLGHVTELVLIGHMERHGLKLTLVVYHYRLLKIHVITPPCQILIVKRD